MGPLPGWIICSNISPNFFYKSSANSFIIHIYYFKSSNIIKQCIDDGKVKIPSNIRIVPALIIKHNGNFETVSRAAEFKLKTFDLNN